jgi:hypothetical protein
VVVAKIHFYLENMCLLLSKSWLARCVVTDDACTRTVETRNAQSLRQTRKGSQKLNFLSRLARKLTSAQIRANFRENLSKSKTPKLQTTTLNLGSWIVIAWNADGTLYYMVALRLVPNKHLQSTFFCRALL